MGRTRRITKSSSRTQKGSREAAKTAKAAKAGIRKFFTTEAQRRRARSSGGFGFDLLSNNPDFSASLRLCGKNPNSPPIELRVLRGFA
jgi:hypothetical protein